MDAELEELIERARHHVLTGEEREQHRRSFAYGNCHLANESITREDIDRAADEQGDSVGDTRLEQAQELINSGKPVTGYLSLYYKQGDDFAHELEQAGGDVAKALDATAERLEADAKDCRALSEMFAGKQIEVNADTHRLSFDGDQDVLKAAAKRDLIGLEGPYEDDGDAWSPDEED